MATEQDPQPPARQPALHPHALASREIEQRFDRRRFHATTFPVRLNVTLRRAASVGDWAAGRLRHSLFTVAGPNASKKTFASGTPQSRNPSVSVFIIGAGPQM